MKRTTLAAIFIAGVFALVSPPPSSGSVSWSVSISTFHQTLSPYGRWVVAGSYGEVWVPGGIAAHWCPYSDGEWIWTDYGWTWVSYDPWGDIPYHYGTWVWADPYGWVWEPGTVWAPAWVTWAWTNDYIGWAPVSPTFGITVSGYYGPPVVVAGTRYVFVPATQFVGVNVQTARVPVTQNAVILSRAQKTTRFAVSGGVVHTAGPPHSFVERVSGKHIERVSVEKAKTRPTTLAAAHVSTAKRIRVVAPAHERAAATAQAGTRERGVRPTKAGKAASAARPSHASRHQTRSVSSKQTAKPTRETRIAKQPSSRAKTHVARANPPKPAAKSMSQTRAKREHTAAARNTVARKRQTGSLTRTHATSRPRETETRVRKEPVKTVPSAEKARGHEMAAAHPNAAPPRPAERSIQSPREEHRVANAAPPQHAAPAVSSPHAEASGQAARAPAQPAPKEPQAAHKQKKEKEHE